MIVARIKGARAKVESLNNFMGCFCIKFFFFFYDIDERRRYTKNVHTLKALVGPSIVKRRIRGDLWAG